MCKEAGLVCRTGEKPTGDQMFWNIHKENTCVDVMNMFEYSSKDYLESQGYKIITLKELKTIMQNQTFNVGDLLYNQKHNLYRRIIDRGVVGNVVFVSFPWKKGEKENTVVIGSAYSISEFEKNGWKVVPESHLTEEPTIEINGKTYKKSDIDALTPIE
jgi:hypothetical protein